MKNALHKQEENQSFQYGFTDIVLCGLVIHIADARMNEYGERLLFPFVGAPENHSAMSLMKSAVKLEVGLQWLMNCIILVLSLSVVSHSAAIQSWLLETCCKVGGIFGSSYDIGITYLRLTVGMC